ncbi:MAG: hypothetical protein JW982_06760 [Spirochaetes bacterium]|nr:hypothetical protein [Spirochaetota bacterium]
MKFKGIFLLCVILIAASVNAVEVNVQEIQNIKKIDFINYTGPAKQNDGINNIYSIGRGLASLSKGRDNQKINFTMKYSMIHAVSREDKDKMSADILIINPEAKVDHIKNIRRILAGYLQSRYNYTEKESLTLAIYATYYNAVYRGDLNFFNEKYKKVVTAQLNAKNAGIALKYTDWPGKTRIVIPLTENSMRGTIEKLDPDELAGDKVRDKLRNDGESLDTRKDMIDIQKENLKDDKKVLAEDKKQVAQEKKQVEQDKKQVEQEKKKVAEEKKQVQQNKAAADKISDPVKKAEETKKNDRKEQEVAKKEEQVAQKEKQVSDKEQEVAKKEDAIKKQEDKIQSSEDQIKQEEKELSRDTVKEQIKQGDPAVLDQLDKREEQIAMKEQELDKREDKIKDAAKDRNVFSDKIYYLRIREYLRNGNYNNDMYLVDTNAMKILKKSNVPNIAGSRYDIFSKGVVVITRKEDTYTENRLTMLDLDTLDAIVTGTDNIFFRSFIEIRDGYIYAVVLKDSKYYLGKFDQNLKLAGISNIEIHEDTFISFFGDKIYINNRDKKIMVLKKDDLKYITVVEGNL